MRPSDLGEKCIGLGEACIGLVGSRPVSLFSVLNKFFPIRAGADMNLIAIYGSAVRVLILAFGMLLMQPAQADRLKDILDSGKVRVGILVDLPPFGMTDKDQKPIGFDIDLANMFAEDLGVKLELIPVTGANRLPYLVTNKVDVIIGAFGATPARAKQIAFSSPYASNYVGVYGRQGQNVKSADQLGKFKVAAARGSSQDISLTKLSPTATIIRFDDEATAAAAFLSGQADMLASPNVVFFDIQKKNPDKKLELKFIIRFVTNHIGIPKGEPELLRWVDTFVFYHRITGDLEALHRKWLNEKMPDLPSM